MLTTRAVFSFGFFNKDAKLTLPFAGIVNDCKINGFVVDVERGGEQGKHLVMVNELCGSVDVIRCQLHDYVDQICDAYEKEKP